MQNEPPVAVPPDGWLRTVRKSLGVSQRAAAENAGVSQQAFDQYERGEIKATISLDCLQRAAAAIDCDVVYFLKPRTAVALSFKAPSKRRRRPTPSAENHSGELPTSLL